VGQAQQERPVLGDVVRGLPEQFRCLLQDLAAGGAQNGRRGRRAGIAP
jgi:hypothetical protein